MGSYKESWASMPRSSLKLTRRGARILAPQTLPGGERLGRCRLKAVRPGALRAAAPRQVAAGTMSESASGSGISARDQELHRRSPGGQPLQYTVDGVSYRPDEVPAARRPFQQDTDQVPVNRTQSPGPRPGQIRCPA